jgi:chloramphenicol-sensitive protein RarD
LKPDGGSPHDRAQRTGIAAALAAYLIWGLAPIYFKQIQAVPPLEIIVHRILWSIPLLAGFLYLREGRDFLRRMRLPRRTLLALAGTGALVAVNWLLFVWAVVNGQILSTSLGYFINPLIMFLLGFVFLRERLTRLQVIAVAIAGSGTLYLGWYQGQPPWIALALAFSFGFYGLFRKMLGVGPMVGQLWETLLLALPASLFLAWRWQSGSLAFGQGDTTLDGLLILTGLITVLPLVWFNVAARHLPLSTVGFFQYIAPSLTFLLSVFVYGEAFTPGHAVAFGCIWFALLLVSIQSVLRARRLRAARSGTGTGREVILVHGLWVGAWVMARLAQQLAARGYSVRRYSYRSTGEDFQTQAQRLATFARASRAGELHFVAHSLGGLVTLKMLAEEDRLPPGRIVLLGSPLGGSEVARKTLRLPAGDRLLGAARTPLEAGYGQIPANRETGMIAGLKSLGLGMLVGGAGLPGDGTVALSETRVPGLQDELALPVTHTGLLYSAEVARQTVNFLRTGRFEHAPTAPAKAESRLAESGGGGQS